MLCWGLKEQIGISGAWELYKGFVWLSFFAWWQLHSQFWFIQPRQNGDQDLFLLNSLLLKIKPPLGTGLVSNFWKCSCPTARCGRLQDLDVPSAANLPNSLEGPCPKSCGRLKGYGSLKSFPGTCSHCSCNWKGFKWQSMLVADTKLFYSFDIY